MVRKPTRTGRESTLPGPPPPDREALTARAQERAEVSRQDLLGSIRGDLKRHEPLSRAAIGLCIYRLGAWARTQPPPIRRPVLSLTGWAARLTRPLTGLHMDSKVVVGDDIHLIHLEGNISIHPDVIIGDRVGIMHNVTIGASEAPGLPIIGDDVFIGTGAVILGPVTVGNGARIGANSLVITDIPAGATAVGVPARVLRSLRPAVRSDSGQNR